MVGVTLLILTVGFSMPFPGGEGYEGPKKKGSFRGRTEPARLVAVFEGEHLYSF